MQSFISRLRRRPRPRPVASRDERGMALLAVIMCMLVVVSLTTVAVKESLGSIAVLAQNRAAVQNADASNAGLAYEINLLTTLGSPAPGAPIPCPASTQVTLAGGNGVVDPASVATYDLYLSTSLTLPTSVASLPNSCAATTPTVPATGSSGVFYAEIGSLGTTASQSGGTGRASVAVVKITDPSSETTFGAATATAHGISLIVAGTHTEVPQPQTAVYPSAPQEAGPVVVSALPADPFLTVGAAQQYAEADASGQSFACSGVVAPDGSVSVGAQASPCTATGDGSGGVSIDLNTIPTVGTILAGVADLTVNFDAVTASASDLAPATPTGQATFLNPTVTVCLLGALGVCTVNTTVPLDIGSTPNQSVVVAIVNALRPNVLLAGLVSLLTTSVEPVLTLESDYQDPTGSGPSASLFVSALHLAVLGDALAGVDVGGVTVGPNEANPVVSPGLVIQYYASVAS
ncbi:MAG: hypothetical protein ACYC1D_02820 [Acidimicrobiales bacterium]